MPDSFSPARRLWFESEATPGEIVDKIGKVSATLEFLKVEGDLAISDLELPLLRHLSIGSLRPSVHNALAAKWFQSLPALRRLQVARSELNPKMMQILGAASWWPKLTYLELSISEHPHPIAWEAMWRDQTLGLQILCVHFLNTETAIAILRANLPDLKYLILGSSINDEFLTALSGADLPALADLELRYTAATPDGFRRFVASPRSGLPRLKRVGWHCDSDRREEYTDWNGALVGWGYAAMSDEELEANFFAGSGLELLPSNDTVVRKFHYELAPTVFGSFISRPPLKSNR